MPGNADGMCKYFFPNFIYFAYLQSRFPLQVLLATNADVDDRGAKGDCTPLMEAAAGGFVDIIQLLLHNKASINAKSTAGLQFCIL